MNASQTERESPPIRRWAWDGTRIGLAGAVMLVTWLLAESPPAAWEESLFRTVNGLAQPFEYLLLPAQQAGMVLAIYVAGLILWRIVRNWRPPAALVVSGTVFGWAAAKLIKEVVERGRPTAFYDDVQMRFDTPLDGLGYPSGHAVVAVLIAIVLSPYLRPRYRWLLYALAWLTCVARVFNAAHLPLDIVGGVAFGVIVGSAINLVVGVYADRAQTASSAEG